MEWNWTDFCSTGIKPFANDTNDLLPCFQEIALQLPVYTLFASTSAFYFGAQTRLISRNSTQLYIINLRIIITIALALLPIWKIFWFYHTGVQLYAIDVLIVSAECIMWVVHCGYLLTMRTYGEINHRGTLFMNVVWLVVVVLDAVWLRSSRHFEWWPWSLVTFVFDLLYGLTLLPNGSAVISVSNSVTHREQEALLANRYTYFEFEFNEAHLGHAQDEANWASRFVFYWVGPLISKGVAGNLKRVEDLFDLPNALNITQLSEKLHLAISQTGNLLRGLHKAYGAEFYLIGILRFIADVAGFAGPLLLGGLLSQESIETESDNENQSSSNNKAYLYALGLFAANLLSALCSTHFRWRMSMIGMKMRIGMVSAIYQKTLEANGLKHARSDILNLMSTDTDRIVNSCISFHSFWSIPFQLFTTLYLLYTQVGAAFVAGLIFAVALIPINRWLAKRIGIYSVGLMKAKDARLSATSEAVHGAKNIKINAWEDIFVNKICKLRSDELKFLRKRKYLDAMCVYFWATTPVLMCLLTFGVSVLMGKPLVASTTYASVALLNMLIGPLNAFPWVLNGLIEAWVSIKRVQKLIDLNNIDYSSYYNPIIRNTSSGDSLKTRQTVLQIKAANFAHDEAPVANGNHQISFRLKNVNLDVKQAELVCIEGPVGGGKSTFISAIIAGVNCFDGEVCVNDLTSGFGYVPQSPWLQNGTIRENITWGAAFDEQWYKNVIYACALDQDIETLGGDLLVIGENGQTLSGGQRARVALARAVYQNKKVYLLDDILSALDAHVAKHIIKHCILKLLKDKTRIVVTRSESLFLHANQILHVQDGAVSNSDYMNESVDLSIESLSDNESKDAEAEATHRRSIDLDKLQNLQDDKKNADPVVLEESREYGYLSRSVFACYWNAVGTGKALAVLSFVLLMQLTRNLSDAWLANWVTQTTLDPNKNDTVLTHQVVSSRADENKTGASHTIGFYMGIYASLAVTNSLVTLARAFLFAYAGLVAAKVIHTKLLNKIMFTKFSFFDVTSVGRILNRFSSDTYTIDDSLPFILNILLAQLVGLAGTLFICLYAMPWLALFVIPMIPIYINLQYRYRHASRDIKRLSSNALSPLYTHFTETLQGLLIIRTMRACVRFQRDFHAKLEESIKAQLTSAAAQQWLDLRMQLLGTILIGGSALLATITSAYSTNPGLVGLAISYVLSITVLLGGLLTAVAETEQELIAVERVNQYMQLEGEENAEGSADPPFGWPTQCVLSYKNVDLKYRDNLPPALHDINFKTDAFERVGIVGRTGAGKSSVLAALLRVAPLTQGEITLDFVNLKTLALHVLRERIGVITQEPFLFEGTVRENLDPRRAYYDSEIWHAIKHSAAATLLIQQLGGLDGHLEQGGINLSAGQRQLICLARVLLKNAKVVCIDEGTANLDNESDVNMQQALRNSFKSSTVIFIAHRLRGLQQMDRIFVLEHGEIKEQGKPLELARNPQSTFYSMLQAQSITYEEFSKVH